MEWSPGASFPHFSALRNGVARRRNAFVLFPSFVPAAAGGFRPFCADRESRPPEATGQDCKWQRQTANPQRLGGLPAAAGTRVWTRVVSLLRERPSFAARRKKAKARPREPISRRFPWESLPDDQGGSAPIGFPTFGRETKVLRGTKEERYLTQAGLAIRSFCPHVRTPSRHPAILPFHERPAQGRSFSFPAPKNSPRRIVIFASLLYNSILG